MSNIQTPFGVQTGLARTEKFHHHHDIFGSQICRHRILNVACSFSSLAGNRASEKSSHLNALAHHHRTALEHVSLLTPLVLRGGGSRVLSLRAFQFRSNMCFLLLLVMVSFGITYIPEKWPALPVINWKLSKSEAPYFISTQVNERCCASVEPLWHSFFSSKVNRDHRSKPSGCV